MSRNGNDCGDSVAARRDDAPLAPPTFAAGRASAVRTRFVKRLARAMTLEAIACAAAAVLLVWLVLYPLLVLLIGSVRTDLPMRPGVLTFANFTALFADPVNRTAMVNTVVSSALATVVALVIGVALAWMTSRTDTPGRRFFD